jgi:Secretion system C-terminal sorting domain
MNWKIIYLLILSLVLIINIRAQVEIPPQSTYNFDESASGNYTTPTIIPKELFSPNSPDIRIHPTTNTTQSEMSITISPVNDQILLASANSTPWPYQGSGYGTGYYFSTDGGETWNGNDIPPSGCENNGDPAVAIDRNGYFYIGSIASNFGQGIMRSTNSGVNWSYYQIANRPGSYILDKNHLAVDNTTGLSTSGNLYSGWTDFNYPNQRGRIKVSASSNQGVNWIEPREVSSGLAGLEYFHQGINLQVGYGTVYACWAVCNMASPYTERGIGFNKSTDGGQTWEIAHYAINNIYGMRSLSNGTLGGIRTNSFPVMAIDNQRDKIYIAWVNVGVPGVNTGDPDVYIISSENQGDSWSTPVRVNTDQIGNSAIQYHCWLSVDQVTGDVYVAFYDNRNSIGTNICEFFVAKSFDEGQTFTDFTVSDNAFSVNPLWSNYNGEYPGLAASSGKVYPLWHSQNPSSNAQGWLSKTVYPLIAIDQKKEDGTRLTFTNIGRWNELSFYDILIRNNPAQISVETNSTEVLRGSQQPYINQKYNNWNILPDVTNHHVFTFDENTPPSLTSNFKSGYYSEIKIKNSLEGTALMGGDIQFFDPWYIDFQDGNYGNNWRNRGMEEPKQFYYRSVGTTGWQPDYSTIYPEGPYPYKGVFLNQPYTGNNPVYYSVKSPAYQDIPLGGQIGTRGFYFQNWDGTNIDYEDENALETGVVFTSSNATASAVLKGQGLSNNLNAFGTGSQRNFVRLYDGTLFNIYTSLDKVWLERSIDNGQNWYLWTNGIPFDNSSEQYDFRPSIDWIPWTVNHSFAAISNITPNANLRVRIIRQSTTYPYYDSCDPFCDLLVHWGYNATPPFTPVIATSSSYIFVVGNGGEDYNGLEGLYYFYGTISFNGSVVSVNWIDKDNAKIIPGSTRYSKNPTVMADKDGNTFHIAWEEGNDIKYTNVAISGGNTTFSQTVTASSGCGYTQNYSPSILVMETDNIARLCWIGKRYVCPDPEEEDCAGVFQYKVLFKGLNNLSRHWEFGTAGNEVSNPNINKKNYNTSDPYYAFAWYESSGQNKFADNTLSTVRTLNTTGQRVQICNGTDKDNMSAMLFNYSSVPYYFKLSDALGNYYNPQKIQYNGFTSGREGVVSVDSADFYFAFGDIEIDGQPVDLIEIADSVEVNNLSGLNEYLVTEPFNVTNNCSFVYSVQYGINDSLSAAQAMIDNRFVNYTVHLVDVNTGETIGEYDDVTYNAENIYDYGNISYQVNTQGIGNRTVRLKLVVDDNLATGYSLGKIYSDESVLGKNNVKQIAFTGSNPVTTYELTQNYPNPFNPSTTIKYQIPRSGNVTVKVFDILGAEVATLVNEVQNEGRYEVNFDASKLASGVYIYRLQANDFSASKKMILLR